MTTQRLFSQDFILCFFSQFTLSLVFCMLIPTIPIYLLRFGAKEGEIGFLVGIFSVSSLVLRPFVGRALLKIPERSFMIAGTLIYAGSSLAYLIAPPFWPLFIVRAFHGFGMGFFSTAIFTMLANITAETNRGQLISYFYLSFNMAFALGPYFGMLFINHFNFNVLLIVCSGLSLISFYMTTKLRKREIVQTEKQPLRLRSFLSREGLPPSIMCFILSFIWGALSAFFPLYALKHGLSNPGIFFIFVAITLFLGRLLGGRILDHSQRERVIMPFLILIVMAIAILLFSATLSMFILAAVILGAGWALVTPFLMIYAIEKAGPARGPAMATYTALGDLGTGLGPMIMGFILELADYPIMWSCLILAGVLNFLYFYYSIVKKARALGG